MNQDILFIFPILLFVVAGCSFFYWYGFETAELKFMPHLECDYLFDDLDYYARAQKEWVGRCLDQ